MKIVRALLIGAVLLSVQGCYYMQAVNGQLDVMRKRQPIDEVMADAGTPEKVRQQLALVNEARDFSIRELQLPDNDSYRSYADLERDYVVWNVFAAPEFSLSPKTWCYPVVGCVSYRGYFSKDKAVAAGERLSEQGFDVSVAGVAAYSTLGRFDDPVLNTMMHWDDTRLIALLFHELAHQLVYVKGDSGFNESFATAVEELGVERWYLARGNEAALHSYRQSRARRQRVMALVEDARTDLRRYYAETIDADEKRLLKEHRLDLLQEQIAAAMAADGIRSSSWTRRPLNNARLLPMSLYEGQLPAFRALLRQCEGDVVCFYRRVREIAELDEHGRKQQMRALLGQT